MSDGSEDHMITRRLLAAAVTLNLLLVAQVASAEDQYYRFDDDLLGAEGLDTKAALIKVRRPQPRVTLIRPRASFVPELLKTVEQI